MPYAPRCSSILRTTLFPVAIFPVKPMTYLPGQALICGSFYHFSLSKAECQRLLQKLRGKGHRRQEDLFWKNDAGLKTGGFCLKLWQTYHFPGRLPGVRGLRSDLLSPTNMSTNPMKAAE